MPKVKLVVLMCLLLLIFMLIVSVYADDGEGDAVAVDWAEQVYAPYVYMGRYPIYTLTGIAEETGIRYFSLAFVLGTQDCVAVWQGTNPVIDSYKNRFLIPDLEALRSMGGDAMISFGGAGGNELAQVCPDVESLKAQYQVVMDTYGITRLDFDIEGDDLHEPDVIDFRSQAIAELQADAQANGRDVIVEFTLPVQPTGLTADGLYVLESAINYGVRVDVVNIMTMNFGRDFPQDAMADNTIQAAHSLFEQLQMLYPEKDDEALWRMVGLTPMVGLNDRQTQTFTLDDAAAVTAFAREQGLGLLAIWSLDRDQQCEYVNAVQNDCSGFDQEEPHAFSMIFNQVITQP